MMVELGSDYLLSDVRSSISALSKFLLLLYKCKPPKTKLFLKITENLWKPIWIATERTMNHWEVVMMEPLPDFP